MQVSGAVVERAVLTRQMGPVFYARIVLRLPSGSLCSVDSRPSDALALALQLQAPLFVANSVAQVCAARVRTAITHCTVHGVAKLCQAGDQGHMLTCHWGSGCAGTDSLDAAPDPVWYVHAQSIDTYAISCPCTRSAGPDRSIAAMHHAGGAEHAAAAAGPGPGA